MLGMQLLRLQQLEIILMSTFTNKDFSLAYRNYRLFHDIYVQLDAGDRLILSGFGLTTAQYRILFLLDPTSEQGERLTDLSDRLLCARSTVTRLIDGLEAAGWVTRDDHSSDRRAQSVLLTPAGIELRARAIEAHERSLVERMSLLGVDEQQALLTILDKTYSMLADYMDKK